MSDLILRAARFATREHAGQRRKYGGSRYILHPARVAGEVSRRADATPEMVAAGWLHDVCEDCGVRILTLEELFGLDVALIVAELSDFTKREHPDWDRVRRKQSERARLAEVSLPSRTIKLIDRIDNLTELLCDAKESPEAARFLPVYREESASDEAPRHRGD